MEKRMSVGQYAFYYGVTTGFALALISLLSYVPVLGTIAWLLRLLALVFLTMYFVRRYRDQFNNGVLTSGEASCSPSSCSFTSASSPPCTPEGRSP